jgi:hypothetical protein
MKKIFTIIAIIGVLTPMTAQPIQYFMQRSSTNVASTSEVENLQVFLAGAHSFVGFEGSPKNILLNVASPITFDGAKQNNRYHSRSEQTRNFASGTISHESFGVHSIFQATVGYNYRLFVSEQANITFGLGGGIKNLNSNYSQWEPELSAFDKKETSFATQMGVRFEMERLNVSVFTNDNSYFGEIVWGRLWDGVSGVSDNNSWSDSKEKTWHGQIALLGQINKETKTSTIRISANAVYKDGFGIGVSYQTDKDLSANVSLRFSKSLRIGYAYQLLHFNPMAKKHEIVLKYWLTHKTID